MRNFKLFLYRYPVSPSCLAHLHSFVWATWVAILKYSLKHLHSILMFMLYVLQCGNRWICNLAFLVFCFSPYVRWRLVFCSMFIYSRQVGKFSLLFLHCKTQVNNCHGCIVMKTIRSYSNSPLPPEGSNHVCVRDTVTSSMLLGIKCVLWLHFFVAEQIAQVA